MPASKILVQAASALPRWETKFNVQKLQNYKLKGILMRDVWRVLFVSFGIEKSFFSLFKACLENFKVVYLHNHWPKQQSILSLPSLIFSKEANRAFLLVFFNHCTQNTSIKKIYSLCFSYHSQSFSLISYI